MRPHPFFFDPPKNEAELQARLEEAFAKLPRPTPNLPSPISNLQSHISPFSRLHRAVLAVVCGRGFQPRFLCAWLRSDRCGCAARASRWDTALNPLLTRLQRSVKSMRNLIFRRRSPDRAAPLATFVAAFVASLCLCSTATADRFPYYLRLTADSVTNTYNLIELTGSGVTLTNLGNGTVRIVITGGSGGTDSNTVNALIASGTSLNASNWLGWSSASNWLHTAFLSINGTATVAQTALAGWPTQWPWSSITGAPAFVTASITNWLVSSITGGGTWSLSNGAYTFTPTGITTEVQNSLNDKLATNQVGAAWIRHPNQQQTAYGTDLAAWGAAITNGCTAYLSAGSYSASNVLVFGANVTQPDTARIISDGANITVVVTNGVNTPAVVSYLDMTGLRIRAIFATPYAGSPNHFYALALQGTNRVVRDCLVQLEPTHSGADPSDGKVMISCCGLAESNRFVRCDFVTTSTNYSRAGAVPFLATHGSSMQYFDDCRFAGYAGEVNSDGGGVYPVRYLRPRFTKLWKNPYSNQAFSYADSGLIGYEEARSMAFPGTADLVTLSYSNDVYGSDALLYQDTTTTATDTDAITSNRSFAAVGDTMRGADLGTLTTARRFSWFQGTWQQINSYSNAERIVYDIKSMPKFGDNTGMPYVEQSGILMSVVSSAVRQRSHSLLAGNNTLISRFRITAESPGWESKFSAYMYYTTQQNSYGTPYYPASADLSRLLYTFSGPTNWVAGQKYMLSNNWHFVADSTVTTNIVPVREFVSAISGQPTTNSPCYIISGGATNDMGVTFVGSNLTTTNRAFGLFRTTGDQGVNIHLWLNTTTPAPWRYTVTAW